MGALRTRVLLSIVGVGLVACDAPPRVVRMHMLPEDFTTAFPIPMDPATACGWSGDMLAIRFPSRYPDAGVERAPGGGPGLLRLVSIETRAEIPGSLREGYVNVAGERANLGGCYDGGAVSFVPFSELAAGWYVLVADFRGLGVTLAPVAGRVEGELAYTRVHVGSNPTWYQTLIQVEGTATLINPTITERPGAIRDGTTFLIAADGVPVTCGPGPLPLFEFRCPLRPRGTRWEFQFNSDSARTPEGGSDARVAFLQTELADSGGGHDTALTSPRFGVEIANTALGF